MNNKNDIGKVMRYMRSFFWRETAFNDLKVAVKDLVESEEAGLTEPALLTYMKR